MFCLGCGSDLTNKQADRRNIASNNVVVDLWKDFIIDASDEESDFSPDSMLTENQCMCRSCFSAYTRYNDMQKRIKDNIMHVLETLPQFARKKQRSDSSVTDAVPSSSTPLMASSLTSAASPDVGVCYTFPVRP